MDLVLNTCYTYAKLFRKVCSVFSGVGGGGGGKRGDGVVDRVVLFTARIYNLFVTIMGIVGVFDA